MSSEFPDDEGIRRLVDALTDDLSSLPTKTDEWPLNDEAREAVRKLQLIARIAETLGNTCGDGGSAFDTPFEWGPLEVLDRIGGGTYGDVYRARDRRLDRTVALKLLREPFPEQKRAPVIIDEARLLARLCHPNVVAVYGADSIRGRTGIWMEFLEGQTLEAELTARGPLPVDEVLQVGIDICRAVGAAHKAGVLHRDLKPQNVMRGADGQIRLTDFGTGRDTADGTTARQLVGTPRYLAPEVLDGHDASERSDIYSLGVLLHRLATGTYPGDPPFSLSLDAPRFISGTPQRAELPDRLASVIATATNADPWLRYASATDMEAALISAAASASASARGRLWLVLPTVVVVLVAAAIGWTPLNRSGRSPMLSSMVLMTAIENHTGEPALDSALEFLLERELSNSGVIRVAGRARVEDTLRIMRRPADSRLDLPLSIELSRRDGSIPAVVASRIDRTADGYIFSSRVVKTADGAVLASFSDTVNTETALPKAMRKQAVSIRGVLGEPHRWMGNLHPQLEKVTTPSLRAAQLYTRAAMQMTPDRVFNNGAAEQLLRDAIREDPQFASAHLLLAWAIHNQRRLPEEYLPHAEGALRFATAVSDAERHFIIGSVHHLRGLGTKDQETRLRALMLALGAYEATLDADSEHHWALTNIQSVLHSINDPARERPIIVRLAENRPNSFGMNSRALWLALLTGDLASSERYAARAAAVIETSDWADDTAMVRLWPATIAWLRDDLASALREADTVARTLPALEGQDLVETGARLANLYLTLGLTRRAEEIVESLPEDDSYRRSSLRAMLLWERGKDAELRTYLRELFGNPQASWRLSPMFVDLRMLFEAKELVRYQRDRSSDRSFVEYCALRVRLADGAQENLGYVQSLADSLRAQPAVAFRPRDIGLALFLADSLEKAGDRAGALLLLEAVSALRSSIAAYGNGYRWVELRSRLAEMYEGAGRVRDARNIERQVARLLQLAEADLPSSSRLHILTGR